MRTEQEMAFPMVRVTLESMRQSMMHAFTGQLDDLQASAEEAMKQALDERNIKEKLRDAIRGVLAKIKYTE